MYGGVGNPRVFMHSKINLVEIFAYLAWLGSFFIVYCLLILQSQHFMFLYYYRFFSLRDDILTSHDIMGALNFPLFR